MDYSDSERTPTFWLTYWRDLKGLQQFSHSAVHRLGRDNYNARKYPYMGIMHETFHAPKGCWETLYEDFPRWGLGVYTSAMNSACSTSANSVIPTKVTSSIWSSKIQINSKLGVRSSQYQEFQPCSVGWAKKNSKNEELATYWHLLRA